MGVCRIVRRRGVGAGGRWGGGEVVLCWGPGGVGVVSYADLLLGDGWRIWSGIAISTLMVLGATAWVVDKVCRDEMSRVNRE